MGKKLRSGTEVQRLHDRDLCLKGNRQLSVYFRENTKQYEICEWTVYLEMAILSEFTGNHIVVTTCLDLLLHRLNLNPWLRLQSGK